MNSHKCREKITLNIREKKVYLAPRTVLYIWNIQVKRSINGLTKSRIYLETTELRTAGK